MVNTSYSNQKERNFDAFKILSALFHRKLTIILTALISSLIALLINFSIEPAYKSSTILEISRNSSEMIEFDKVTSVGEDLEFYGTQHGLLTSPSLAASVIKALNLTATQLGASDTSENFDEEAIEELFLSHLTITPVPKSRLVKLSYENANPNLAKEIINTLAENFIHSNMERKKGANSYARDYLDSSINDSRKKLDESIHLLDKYISTNKIIKFDESQSVKLNSLKRMEEMLSTAERDLIDAESNKRLFLGSDEGLSINNNSTIQALTQQKIRLLADYQEMLQIYKPNYPSMQQLQKKIRHISQEISLEKNNLIRDSKIYFNNNYEASKERVSKLKEKINYLKNNLLLAQNKNVKYDSIKRDISRNQEFYDTLLKRFNELTFAEKIATNNISIVSKATISRKKIRPKRLLNLMAGIFLGLFIGSLLALFKEVIHGIIRTESDLQQISHLPILGKIPRLKARSGIDSALLFYSDAHSALPEAIYTLRVNLMHDVAQQSPSSILFTSATSNEGKTSTAINLAYSYILLGKKVLLIDADMRNPSIDKRLLKLRRKIGLSSYLLGQSSLENIVMKSTVSNDLSFIPSGDIPKNPVELLSSKKMIDLIKIQQEKFDVVIVDSSPVRDIPDSIILSTLVDVTVLSVQINKTNIKDLSYALSRFENTKSNLLGIVATDIKSSYSHYRAPKQLFPTLTKKANFKGLLNENITS